MSAYRKKTAKEFSVFLEALEALPANERVLEGLYTASDLIQEAAYAYAPEIEGEQIVNLILLADSVEREAKKLMKKDSEVTRN